MDLGKKYKSINNLIIRNKAIELHEDNNENKFHADNTTENKIFRFLQFPILIFKTND